MGRVHRSRSSSPWRSSCCWSALIAAGLAQPPAPPVTACAAPVPRCRRRSGLGAPIGEPSEGMYVCTTTAGDWLDRIAAHAWASAPTPTCPSTPTACCWPATAPPDLFIPAPTSPESSRTSGMAGKFVEKDGLLVISWMLGTQAVDTGFRTRATDHRTPGDRSQRIAALAGTRNRTTTTDHPPKQRKTSDSSTGNRAQPSWCSKTDGFSAAAATAPSAPPWARRSSPPACPATRRPSPTPPTHARSSCRPPRTSATPA